MVVLTFIGVSYVRALCRCRHQILAGNLTQPRLEISMLRTEVRDLHDERLAVYRHDDLRNAGRAEVQPRGRIDLRHYVGHICDLDNLGVAHGLIECSTGLTLVGVAVALHLCRVLLELDLPRGSTLGPVRLRLLSRRRWHHDTRRGHQLLVVGQSLRIELALGLDFGHGEVVAELARTTLHLHPVVAHPAVRHAAFAGDPGPHPGRGQPSRVVIPTGRQGPCLAQLDSDLVV